MIKKLTLFLFKIFIFLTYLTFGTEIIVYQPNVESISEKAELIIKGKCHNTSILQINETPVLLNPDGSFEYKTNLINPEQNHYYTLEAFHSDFPKSEKIISVLYQPKIDTKNIAENTNVKKNISKKFHQINIIPTLNILEKKIDLQILSPLPNSKLKNKNIQIIGIAKNCNHLLLNDKPYPLSTEGHFIIDYTFKTINMFEEIKLIGVGKNNQKKTASLNVYLDAPSPKIKFSKQPKTGNTPEKTIYFEGIVTNTIDLWANNERIPLSDKGNFIYEKRLVDPYKKTNIIFKAEGIANQVHTIKKSFTLVNQGEVSIQLQSPPYTLKTTKTSILFKGSVKNANELWINNNPVKLKPSGHFEYHVNLDKTDQAQEFVLYAKNEFGAHSSEICEITYSPPKPTLTILEPKENSISKSNEIIIKGQANNAYAVDINNTTVSIDEFGYFTHKIYLKKPNSTETINISTYSDHPEEVQLTRKITYNPLKSPVLFIQHPPKEHQTTDDYVIFKGQAQNCDFVLINNRKASLDKQGNFKEQFNISNIDTHKFVIEAIGLDKSIIQNTRNIIKKEKPKIIAKQINKKPNLKLATNPNLVYLNKKVSLEMMNADIRDVMKLLAQKTDLNIVADQSLEGEISISLTNVTIKQALELVLGTNGLSYRIIDKNIIVGNSENLNNPIYLETRIISLDNMTPQQASELLKEHIKTNESVNILEQQNKIIITADSSKIDKLVDIVTSIDKDKVPQIVLEAQILEISKTATSELGIDWIQSAGMNYSLDIELDENLKTAINFLQEQGKAKMLAKPRIQAIDKEAADIFIGQQIPITRQTTDSNGNVTQSLEFINSGITLTVQPFINTRTGDIKIKIQPEITQATIVGDTPTLTTSRVNTTVFVKDGQMVLIGGLYNSSNTENKDSVPFLSKLPVISPFFNNKAQVQQESEIMIAITPKIINGNETP